MQGQPVEIAGQTQSRLTEWVASSSEFLPAQAGVGDGGFALRKTIAKAFGLDDATRRRGRRRSQWVRFRDFAFALAEVEV